VAYFTEEHPDERVKPETLHIIDIFIPASNPIIACRDRATI